MFENENKMFHALLKPWTLKLKRQRVDFKICPLVYECLHQLAPPHLVSLLATRGLKKLPGQEVASWKFPTEEIMGAHNFYSALIFPKMGVLAPKFAFLKKNFPTGENVSDNFPTAQNLGAGAIALLPPLPRRHGCSLKWRQSQPVDICGPLISTTWPHRGRELWTASVPAPQIRPSIIGAI